MSEPRYRSLRGMRDLVPEDSAFFQLVEATFWEVSRLHGFAEIRTPILESTELFTRPLGESSDVVHKEMYSFTDRSDNAISLRPEGTAGVARAYLEQGMGSWPQPVKLAYCGRNYRYDRPQASRYREHEQFGLEVFGATDASVDAEVILTAWQGYQRLGLDDVVVQINSIGEAESRDRIRRAIVKALKPIAGTLPEDAQRQLKENPMRILDTKDPATLEAIEVVPPLIDELTEADRAHLTAVLEYLEAAGVPFELNPRIVRGFDYYTRTVFEFWGGSGGQLSLGSGGRYDGLMETLGGPPTPGVGIGIGVDRIVDYLKEQGKKAPRICPQVFIIQLGEEAKQIAFRLLDELTTDGVSVSTAPGKESIRSQLKVADRFGASLALIIGQKEAIEGTVIVRDMASGVQETVPVSGAAAHVQTRLPSDVRSGKAA